MVNIKDPDVFMVLQQQPKIILFDDFKSISLFDYTRSSSHNNVTKPVELHSTSIIDA